METTKNLTQTQEFIATEAVKWFNDEKAEQVFSYTGFAGTGKSFLVEEIINRLGVKIEEVAFTAFTGKAALVLTNKANGRYTATTIHRLCYELDGEAGGPTFKLRPKETVTKKYKLIVVDEASMVDGGIEEDLKSFGVKILAIGDRGQLEPASNGKPGTLLSNPIAELTEIHRQAQENPIIYLSMLARQGKRIEPGKYGDTVIVLRKKDLTANQKVALYKRADQIICGYNKTRQAINSQVRKSLGFNPNSPQVGDKLICAKNNWTIDHKGYNLINGMTGYVRSIEPVKEDSDIKRAAYNVNFQPDFMEENEGFEGLLLLHDDFTNTKVQLERDEYNLYERFDYGYAITCHKSQGSSWGNVVLFNEVLNAETHNRWLYTAITRAEERLIIFI